MSGKSVWWTTVLLHEPDAGFENLRGYGRNAISSELDEGLGGLTHVYEDDAPTAAEEESRKRPRFDAEGEEDEAVRKAARGGEDD